VTPRIHEVMSWADQAESLSSAPKSSASTSVNGSDDGGWIENWIAQHPEQIKVRRGPVPCDGSGRQWELEVCPFQPDYRAGEAAIFEGPDGFGFHCFCGDHKPKHWHDLRDLVEPGWQRKTPPNNAPVDDARSLRIVDVPSIFSFDEKGIEWAVDQFIAMNAITLLSGDSGLLKSTIMTSVGRSVADGSDFAGMTTTQREVIYLDKGENTLNIVQNRFRRLDIVDGAGFRYFGDWNSCEVPAPGSMSVIEYAQATNPKPLIVIDALISNLDGDENSSVDIRAFMRQPRRLAGLGCAVGILHNAGKGESSKQFRGSSDIKASVDVAYEIEGFGDPTRLERLKLTAFKSRFATRQTIDLKFDGSRFSSEQPDGPCQTVTEQLRDLLIARRR
jgi:hypothetical protein